MVVIWLKRVAGSLSDDLSEPLVERYSRKASLTSSDDLDGGILQTIDLETLMVETTDGILVAPMVIDRAPQFAQSGKLPP